MKSIAFISCLTFLLLSCSRGQKEAQGTQLSDQFVNGELSAVAKARGLTSDDLISAVKTYNPSGASEEYLAFIGTGVSGRLAVVAMPSMKILKFVSVFSAEPWQGYAYDDESKAIISNSNRDEIAYSFGDMGAPALSLTKGEHDGRAVFIADATNGRIALVDIDDYETKQIVTHPLFKQSNSDVAVTVNSEFAVQVSGSATKAVSTKNKPMAGMTFWRFVEKQNEAHKVFFIDPTTSFTVILPPGPQSAPVAGRNASEGAVFNISEGTEPYLNIVQWKTAVSLLGTKAAKVDGHFTFTDETAKDANLIKRLKLPAGAFRLALSGDGKFMAVMNKTNSKIELLDVKSLLEGKISSTSVDVGGPTIDAAFTEKNLYVTVHNPNKVVRISLSDKEVKENHALDFPVGKIIIPEADTMKASEKYAIVVNHSPYGRFTRIGPTTGLSAHLMDISEDKIRDLYDSSIPQSTRLAGVVMSTKMNKPVFKYKIGTNPRTGLISDYKTSSGQEKIVRNNKRVHVYATVIRSHITPDYIEVEQGDTVTIHITSNEQSKDNTHGFTIGDYNVHGSFEPGKTASVTFVADQAGVYPFYCTEFCSALHLEMQGYLLVKPNSKGETSKLLTMQNNPKMKNFFKYIKGE